MPLKPKLRGLQVTEGILYSLLPSLMEATANQHEKETSIPTEAFNEVAASALSVSCLLNAPPGFVEFLLCTPWSQIDLLCNSSDAKEAIGAINITNEQRRAIVNTRIPDHLLPVVMAFIYQPRFEVSLPPMLVRTHDGAGNAVPPPMLHPPSGDADHAPLTARLWPTMTWEVCRPPFKALVHFVPGLPEHRAV